MDHDSLTIKITKPNKIPEGDFSSDESHRFYIYLKISDRVTQSIKKNFHQENSSSIESDKLVELN